MRFGVISDVHGNLHALRAAVLDLHRHGVDGWLSVGDLIGYGPYPNECATTVAELGAVGVAGNHELITLGKLPGASSSERAQQTHRWTAAVLRDDVVAYLTNLPRLVEINGIVVTHGSLDDPEEYVSTSTKAGQQLAQLSRDYPAARYLLLGHTHRQQLFANREGRRTINCRSPISIDAGQTWLANPGSIGQSRQWEWPPAARAMILDVDRQTILFHRIRYDFRAYRRALRKLGLPYRSMHSPPSLRAAVRRRARRALRPGALR
jgi:predicted phosphodiesterase